MKLVLKSSHLSIREFPAIELPEFALVTGLNGAGKTHLLKAIEAGNIAVEGVEDVKQGIRFFDWNNMVPKDTGRFASTTLFSERQDLFETYSKAAAELRLRVETAARNAGLTGIDPSDITLVANLTEEELIERLGDESQGRAAKTSIAGAVESANRKLLGKLPEGPEKRAIEAVVAHAKRPIIALRREDFLSEALPSWGGAEAFQQSFARLFVAYRDMALKNKLKQLQELNGRPNAGALTDDQFERAHMLPPWIFVNEAIKRAGLDFEINCPDEYDNSPYEPKLTKRSSKVEMKFADLSSGEKILMSFALCLYYAKDKRQITTYPKLLLLDEIDAPLHPSMSRSLIDTICGTLVADHGISVIAATHSPSTVAIAPEDALYVMKPDVAGLHKTTKAQALNILTVGVPTLSFSYEGRRQVFVESSNDARIYAALYELLKTTIGAERSLEFVETGGKKDGSDHNTGCDTVKRIVKALSEAGNTSVFALIDWDGTNKSSARIAVLAEGRRNGLENALLDPLLVAASLARNARGLLQGDREQEESVASYVDFLGLPPSSLQKFADFVQAKVLGKAPESTVNVGYVGGFELQVDETYLKTDDHLLEGMILAAFPPLKAFARRPGEFMMHIVTTIATDKPAFVPQDILGVFDDLLKRPSH